ncbi:GMC oxidoreductase [Mesorhizobium onobrychidis]|uniref:Glucose-methanol-choline oxidoreductase C-terminal domain-containing protein n=1 Tax=Mesorhizobium onobrychidis TaxID=2775404 RepID=A0ABY5R546_9HYPH|nr:GMC oxidoreductase [Mesorhizobium onobrychidis]UVC17966.1 hypothetical protein IHQ72_13260 [Mesorhizobium onobrychidis]
MGSTSDTLAVMTPSGKVIGMEGLHVIDASIMPTIPCANTKVRNPGSSPETLHT